MLSYRLIALTMGNEVSRNALGGQALITALTSETSVLNLSASDRQNLWQLLVSNPIEIVEADPIKWRAKVEPHFKALGTSHF